MNLSGKGSWLKSDDFEDLNLQGFRTLQGPLKDPGEYDAQNCRQLSTDKDDGGASGRLQRVCLFNDDFHAQRKDTKTGQANSERRWVFVTNWQPFRKMTEE